MITRHDLAGPLRQAEQADRSRKNPVITLDCPSCGKPIEHRRDEETAHCSRCGNAWAWKKGHYRRTRRSE